VHATQHEVKEGSWPGAVVMIGFPGIAEARHGGTPPPTERSRRCAHSTSTVTSSWSKVCLPTTPRPLPCKPCGRP
jgi:hypothetical protein